MTRLETYEAAMAVCDPTLGDHAARVTEVAEAVARRLGWSEPDLERLRLGAALHDVGKITTPPGLLDKPGPLSTTEMETMRAHPVEGVWLISGVRSLEPALPYVLFHHERWDGNGYPTRRGGTDIPAEGRILAVADSFDAMTSHRAYRAARSTDEALSELRRCSGSQFDPDVVDAFFDAVDSGALAGV